MQHGENGAYVPRRVSNIMGKAVCNGHNSRARRKPQETDRFLYGRSADMGQVRVVIKKKRSCLPK